MKRSWLIRGAAFGAGMTMIAGVLALPSVSETTAAWSDSQLAAANFEAVEIPDAKNVDCDPVGTGPLGIVPGARITWTEAGKIGASIVNYKVVGKVESSDDWVLLDKTSEQSYTFGGGLLDAIRELLDRLLAGNTKLIIGIVITHNFSGSTWESQPTNQVEIKHVGLLGFACD